MYVCKHMYVCMYTYIYIYTYAYIVSPRAREEDEERVGRHRGLEGEASSRGY